MTSPEERARALLDFLAPGSELISVTVAEGSFSNYTHVLTAQPGDGRPYRVVVRLYKVFGTRASKRGILGAGCWGPVDDPCAGLANPPAPGQREVSRFYRAGKEKALSVE